MSKTTLGWIAFIIGLFLFAYALNQKNKNDENKILQYEIEKCLDQNPYLSYKVCKEKSISHLRFMSEMEDTDMDATPSYR